MINRIATSLMVIPVSICLIACANGREPVSSSGSASAIVVEKIDTPVSQSDDADDSRETELPDSKDDTDVGSDTDVEDEAERGISDRSTPTPNPCVQKIR